MSKPKRHVVSIMRPTGALDARGQLTGATTMVAQDVPCSIEALSGRELELAKQKVANAEQRVMFYDDPDWQLTTKDWLEFGSRRLNIGSITRPEEIELEVVLLCGEAV